MATLLHIYAKITWRGGEDAAVKQAAALQLLTEPYCRLSLSMLPSAIAKEAPGASLESLTQILGPDPHFTVDRSTGNVLLNSAELLQSGKSTLKQLVERAWPQHGVDPHQWACHQLARYVIEGQQMDVRTADLFTARLDGAGGCAGGTPGGASAVLPASRAEWDAANPFVCRLYLPYNLYALCVG